MAIDKKLQIFRSKDAPGLMESGVMTLAPMTDQQMSGVMKMVDAGYIEGDVVDVPVNIPGFSLVRAWLKSDYPLLLHSHDSDCLYYIVAGSLVMGTETLGAGDSFFVPGGTAYTYRPGPDGVEVLEFRHASAFDFQNHTKSEAFYEKALETVTTRRADWREAKRPSGKA
jgi:hypothetical protein